MALLISTTVAGLLSCTVRSTRDTFGVGTRTAIPLSFPSSWGRTSATAFAAPVVVGIMERAADLALLRSLWGKSRSLWSPV